MTVNMAAGQTDFYKMFHKEAYHPNITKVYSNYTSRSGKLSNIPDKDGVVFVGLQYFIKDYLIKEWNETFFDLPKKLAISSIKRITDNCLGINYDASHFEDLHDLGYLPLEIKSLPEGVVIPYGVPPVTFINTVEGFHWLSNYIETAFSTENWPIQTSATTARAYLKNFTESFDRCGLPHDLIPFMCHDFSFRGCFGRHAAAMSGFGHLCSFAGTDTIPSILFSEKYYNADVEKELVGASVCATEHSTATSYITSMASEKGITKLEAEVEYVRYLMNKVPTGILSHVSDSYDFWEFVTRGLPHLKDEIMSREGKLVVRPDSGDPVDILCGTNSSPNRVHTQEVKTVEKNPEYFGLIECLWKLFGGTKTEKGYRVLDEHIGAIYGDSITIERQEEIIKRLEMKGFAPVVVLGVGSYSYQHVTRDTHGSAVKATWVEKDGYGVDVFKDPATDRSKKSATGLLRVELEDGAYKLYDKQSKTEEKLGQLTTVFKNGRLLRETSLEDIRKRVKESITKEK